MRRYLQRFLGKVGPNRDSHNERIKLVAPSFNAIGLAALLGGLIAPSFDPTRHQGPVTAIAGVVLWMVLLLAALELLGYIQSKD